MKREKGLIIYRGASILDGAPIVAIATFKTSNAKTGDMVQVWIIREDLNPVEASKLGADSSICGACTHRHSLGGACYVNIGQAPNSIWKAYQRGAYRVLDILGNDEDATIAAHHIHGRKVRLGAYGDPAAVPFEVFEQLLKGASGWTGYTHQARHKHFDPRLFRYCMASADTPRQAQKLQSRGARTFRVKTAAAPRGSAEIECLADSKGMQCIDCGLCNGASDTAPNIVINVHGSRSNRFNASLGGAQLIARG